MDTFRNFAHIHSFFQNVIVQYHKYKYYDVGQGHFRKPI